MSFWSFVRDLFSPASPPPTMARPGPQGQVVRMGWHVYQLDVYIADLALSERVVAACIWWNNVVGRRWSFLTPPMDAPVHIMEAFADPVRAKLMRGVVLVQRLPGEHNHGNTLIQSDSRTGEMHTAIVSLPDASRDRDAVDLHEFGHVLGLDHGPDGTLMAAHLTAGPKPLAEYQARYVRTLGK